MYLNGNIGCKTHLVSFYACLGGLGSKSKSVPQIFFLLIIYFGHLIYLLLVKLDNIVVKYLMTILLQRVCFRT